MCKMGMEKRKMLTLHLEVKEMTIISTIKKKVILLAAVGACAFAPYANAGNDAYEDYIATYSSMAIEQQTQYGIPASITLAQGLLESAAGRSVLATEGNNHFGIKCHNEWKGSSMVKSDDAPDDCFRVYDNPSESYADHSRFLTRKRYEPLFKLDPSDYAAWAKTLRKCGYATDPNYADRLITIIERYGLNNLDTEAGRHIEETADYIASVMRMSHPVRRSRGLHYVVACPGDTYAKIAKEFNMNAKKLMKLNDVNRDGEIKPWQEVYLQEKLDEAPEGVATATIGEGESLHSVAQRYGMKLDVLKKLNSKAKDHPGETLHLR